MFKNREHAASELAAVIARELDQIYRSKVETIHQALVVAIPRGAVVMGDIISNKLGCSLDVVISRKIRSHFNDEFAIGAVMPDGEYFINDGYVDLFNISQEYLEREIEFQKNEIKRRMLMYRGNTSYEGKFDNKIIILVDDGIATGATIMASAKWIRGSFKCKAIIIAVPVAPMSDKTLKTLEKIVDKVIILHKDQNFAAVGQFYEKFDQISDIKVKEILDKYK